MENNELKNLALHDEQLEGVAGGDFGDWETCPVCGKPKREGYLCIHCEMADGVVTCFRCRSPLTREGGCAHCGTTWEEYAQVSAPLRNP